VYREKILIRAVNKAMENGTITLGIKEKAETNSSKSIRA